MDNITFDDFIKIDLRVAEIKACEDIEGADKLYKLTVDMGEERLIVAGIKQYYAKEELIGKRSPSRPTSTQKAPATCPMACCSQLPTKTILGRPPIPTRPYRTAARYPTGDGPPHLPLPGRLALPSWGMIEAHRADAAVFSSGSGVKSVSLSGSPTTGSSRAS